MTDLSTLEREVEEGRARLDRDIAALRRRLTPLGLADEALGLLGRPQGQKVRQSLRGMATENTLPLLVAGLGIGWLVWKSRRDWGRKYPLPSRGNGRGRNGPPPRYSDALADEE